MFFVVCMIGGAARYFFLKDNVVFKVEGKDPEDALGRLIPESYQSEIVLYWGDRHKYLYTFRDKPEIAVIQLYSLFT